MTRKTTLPRDACPNCATLMLDRKGKLHKRVNGEDIAVSNVPHLRCPRCREIVLRFEDMRSLEIQAIEIYRTKYRLLPAAEIRALRERLGVTQARLARLLRLGGNTLSRWEAGRNVQTASMDVLLRLVRDVPGSLKYLRNRSA